MPPLMLTLMLLRRPFGRGAFAWRSPSGSARGASSARRAPPPLSLPPPKRTPTKAKATQTMRRRTTRTRTMRKMRTTRTTRKNGRSVAIASAADGAAQKTMTTTCRKQGHRYSHPRLRLLPPPLLPLLPLLLPLLPRLLRHRHHRWYRTAVATCTLRSTQMR